MGRSTADQVTLIDQDGPVSVTNDAEAVVTDILRAYGGSRRILYMDTDGHWGELLHDGLKFTGFGELTTSERLKLGLRENGE